MGGYAFPTTMITGTLTLLGMDAGQAIFGRRPDGERAAIVRRIKAFSRVVLAFAAGVALGGLMTTAFHFGAIVLPVVAVALCARRQAQVSTDLTSAPA